MVYALWKVSAFLVTTASVPLGSCWLPPLRSTTASTRSGTTWVVVVEPVPRTLLHDRPHRDDDDSRRGSHHHDDDGDVPDSIRSPVLRQVYPQMVRHLEEYGNPNIPLGSSEGRQCETLRRLHTQNKLTDDEVELLTELGFRWHNLEDIYEVVDFDELYQRLVRYRRDHDDDDDAAWPPKKYPSDPELGAWVTGLRRRGPDHVSSEHRAKLDEIGFRWVSQRKCGSSFMKQYRAIAQRLADGADAEEVWGNEDNRKWLRAQQMAFQRNDLSETRVHYLEQLLGADWTKSNLDS